jgi:hypothetical protein
MSQDLWKQQNTLRNFCRLALPAACWSCAPIDCLDGSTSLPSTAGRADPFSRRTAWRRMASKQQRCPADNLLRRAAGTGEQKWSHIVLWPGTKALSGATGNFPGVKDPPLHPEPRATLLVVGEIPTCVPVTISGISVNFSQQGIFTETQQQPTEVTENGSQCGSTTIRELHLKPHRSWRTSGQNPALGAYLQTVSSGDPVRWEHCKCKWGEAYWVSVQTPKSWIYKHPTLYITSCQPRGRFSIKPAI